MSFKYQVVAAPMAGFTNRAYRDIVRGLGADATYGEMVSTKALVYQNKKTLELLDISGEASPRIVQLFGSEPADMEKAAAVVAGYGAEIIDINMGCPVPKVVRNNEGAALMKQRQLAAQLVAAAKSSGLPVSVKIRAGWDAANVNAVEFAQKLESVGACFLAVHGRTREQFYHGNADWDIISQVKSAVSIPVIGNGDINTAGDAVAMIEQTGCDGVMVGRGMLGNPWLFADIKAALAGKEPQGRPAPEEIIKLALAHLTEQIRRSQVFVCGRAKNEEADTMRLGEELAIKSMRSMLGYYIKGMKGAAALRHQINSLETYQQMEQLFESYLAGQFMDAEAIELDD